MVGEFNSIATSLKLKNHFKHADTLAYPTATLEDNSPRKITVDNLDSPSISWIKRDLSSIFPSVRVLFSYNYKQSFNQYQVVTRKRRRIVRKTLTE